MLGRGGPPRWVEPEFSRRVQLAERLRQESDGRDFSSFAQADLCQFLTSGWESLFIETAERSGFSIGLEQRHPFYDRRIVEFALALPEEQRWRQNQAKFVLRQAMRRLLPDTVRQRRDKADWSHVTAEALHAQGGERFFDSLAVASLGWVDGKRVCAMYRQMAEDYLRGDEHYTRHLWPLWMIFGTELWFKTVFPDRARVQPTSVRIQETRTASV